VIIIIKTGLSWRESARPGLKGKDRTKMKSFTIKSHKTLATALILLLCSGSLNLGFWRDAKCASAYQISGFYLGATPEDIGIKIEIDPLLEEKHYEVKKNDASLYFVRVKGKLRLYRIVKEEAAKPKNIQATLDGLKKNYGTPDRQEIKTSNVRPKNKKNYVTTVKNKALWNIDESQEFIVEIESNRIVYELIEHDPRKIKLIKKPDGAEDEGLTRENWNPDY
jgi:hypothetical protein